MPWLKCKNPLSLSGFSFDNQCSLFKTSCKERAHSGDISVASMTEARSVLGKRISVNSQRPCLLCVSGSF